MRRCSRSLEDNGVVEGTGEPAPPAGKDGYKGEFATELITLDMLAKKLRKARFKNGAVKFDREELHFDVDENGKPTRCYFRSRKTPTSSSRSLCCWPTAAWPRAWAR